MVYVDEATYPWRGKKWCHLTADNLAELHQFAAKLKLKREWFQNKRIPHYDITESKRLKAIELGAIAISTKEMVKRVRETLAIKDHRHRKD